MTWAHTLYGILTAASAPVAVWGGKHVSRAFMVAGRLDQHIIDDDRTHDEQSTQLTRIEGKIDALTLHLIPPVNPPK